MANVKWTEFPSGTPVGTDLLSFVSDPGGTPENQTVTVEDFLSGGFGGTLLDSGSYQHGSNSDSSKATSSTTLVDWDATNLIVTGTVPASGNLLVVLIGYPHTDNNERGYWGLRTASGIVSGTQRLVSFSSGLAAGQSRIEYLITGLTPGAAFDYRFAGCSGGSNAYLCSGPTNGPATIEAWSIGPGAGESLQQFNAQTGTSYTLVAADATKIVTMSNASASTLTVPQDSDATISIGAYIDIMQLGAGQVTVQAGTGATLRVSGLTAKARAQYSRLAVQKIAANTWSLMGDLAAS